MSRPVCCPCNQAERELWDSATTIADLGELTAAWLEGSIAWNPTYTNGDIYAAKVGTFARPPEDETMPYVHLLAAANRAGFVTKFSQPGEVRYVEHRWRYADGSEYHTPHDERDRWQRATVSGFMDSSDKDRLLRLRAQCEAAGLTVHSWRASRCTNATVITDNVFVGAWTPNPVSERDFKRTLSGHNSRPSIPAIRGGNYSRLPAGTYDALCEAIYVVVIDSEIGRNDRLWPALECWVTQESR